MPIDFTLTPELLCLRGDARAFARDVLSKVGSATRDLPTPLARFAAIRPFYEQTVRAGFLRRLIPAALGGQGTGIVDMAVLAEEFHAVDVNISLTLLGTMLGLFPVLLGGTPEQAARFFAPFAAGHGAPLAAFAFSEPGGSANFAAPAPAEGVRTQEQKPAVGLGRIVADREKEMIETALAESRGRIAGSHGAAEKLGVPRSTLESKIRALGINKHRFKS